MYSNKRQLCVPLLDIHGMACIASRDPACIVNTIHSTTNLSVYISYSTAPAADESEYSAASYHSSQGSTRTLTSPTSPSR